MLFSFVGRAPGLTRLRSKGRRNQPRNHDSPMGARLIAFHASAHFSCALSNLCGDNIDGAPLNGRIQIRVERIDVDSHRPPRLAIQRQHRARRRAGFDKQSARICPMLRCGSMRRRRISHVGSLATCSRRTARNVMRWTRGLAAPVPDAGHGPISGCGWCFPRVI